MSIAALVGLAAVSSLRPPSVPLMVQDPYTSFWSPYDHLYDGSPTRWSGEIISWTGVTTVDGQCYRWLGAANTSCSTTAKQIGLDVDATLTTYTFEAGSSVQFTVQFRTASVMEESPDYSLLSLPFTNIRYSAKSLDGKDRQIEFYFDSTAEPAIAVTSTVGNWERSKSGNYGLLKIGSDGTFDSNGGKNEIAWGKFIIAYDSTQDVSTSLGVDAIAVREAFNKGNPLPPDNTTFRPVTQGYPVAALATKFNIGATSASFQFLIGFDEGDAAIQFFGTKLPPLWLHIHGSIENAVSSTMKQIDSINQKCDAFDSKLRSDMNAKGKTTLYGEMGSLAYRQVTGGTKLVFNQIKNETWLFLKEISSDGDVSTVDVIYPSSPAILHYSPELYRILMLPILAYANNETAPYGAPIRYNLQWAPHHLGHWPICDLAPNKQEQMPVEETANLLLNIRYVTRAQNDTKWLTPYWGLLETWGSYLITVLPDPGNQLCTDDFEGPSPHNANLAVKGIVALGAYSQLMTQIGNHQAADAYMNIAKNFGAAWVLNATDASGTHTKLQYNLTGTWSQKYNLVWQPIFGLDLIPASVISKDMAFYKTKMQKYGLPLDSRALFTKTDWSMWIAAMAPQDQFLQITEAVYKWTNESTSRVPWSDWYWTNQGTAKGFKARPVLGGIFAKMLMP